MPTLTAQQLVDCQNLINDMAPGIYEIKEIYGDLYEAIENPKVFGKAFYAAVIGQLLINIEFDHLNRGNKHLYYKVKGG